jgi:hypothetical protein
MLELNAFKSLTPEIKATITSSSINTDLLIRPEWMISKLQALDVVVNKLFKDHQNQLHSEWFLTGDHALS